MTRLRLIARSTTLAATLATTLTLAGAAMAQPSAADAVAAQALFDEGKRLMAAGKYADACPKLEESERLDPAGGTIYALALCDEGFGKTATAWAYFNQALTEARKDRRADREAASAEHVRALEKRLTRVRVTVASPVDGLIVKRTASPSAARSGRRRSRSTRKTTYSRRARRGRRRGARRCSRPRRGRRST